MSRSVIVQRSDGFTLLEVLIAIVITALIGLGSWQLLNSAIRTNEQTQARLDELKQLQRALFFIARDLQQVAPRGIRDEYGDLAPALTTKNEFYALEFTRAGWRNPLGDIRSELQRVAYELDQEGWLVRHYWSVLDRAQDTSPRSRKLLEGAEVFTVAFLTDSAAWVDEWPPESESEQNDPYKVYNTLPVAIRVELEHPRFGKITRLFELPHYMEHGDIASSGSGEGDGQGGDGSDNGSNNGSGIPTVGGESAEEQR
ncbi:MAG: type II secretion system protein GspJ [Oleiphilus sp.]|nr:MAG: type II secretion system protein GspJ [Oleiphilus sp.]